MVTASNRIVAHLPLHEWASLRTELVWIYDREVAAQYRQSKGNSPPGYRAWLIRSGTVSISSGTQTMVGKRGEWIMPPRGYAEHIFSRNASILSVHFLCQWPSGEDLLSSRKTLAIGSGDYPALERNATRLERLLRKQFPGKGPDEHVYTSQSSDYENFLHVQSLFLNWLSLWFRACMEHGAELTRLTSGDSRPFQAARCLNQAPLDRPFPVEWLQRDSGLGLMRLNQLFFTEFGLTTRKYWDRRRLDFARQCLETSLMPMKEISYRLGFRSDSHFVIWFRRLTGARPGDYRRSYFVSVDGRRKGKRGK